jgi:hypothetical protein
MRPRSLFAQTIKIQTETLPGAERWREQHRHVLGLTFVPRRDQALGILKHLGIGRAARSGFRLGSLPALIFCGD